MHRTRNAAYSQGYREFESPPLRQKFFASNPVPFVSGKFLCPKPRFTLGHALLLYAQELTSQPFLCIQFMKLKFDPAKSERNQRERDLPFERVYDFDISFRKANEREAEKFGLPQKRYQ